MTAWIKIKHHCFIICYIPSYFLRNMNIYKTHEYDETLILDHIRLQCDISPDDCLCYMRLWDTKVETGKKHTVDGQKSQSIQPIIYIPSRFMVTLLLSSPEPKARRWAYSIARHPLSVVINIFKWHLLWSHLADSCHFTYSIYRQGEQITFFFCPNQITILVAMATYSYHWLTMGKLLWRLGHENISTAILPLRLIQEEQLSVTGERMCTKYW